MRGLLSGARSAAPRSEYQDAGGGIEIDLNNPDHVAYLRGGGMSGSGAVVSERSTMSVAAAWRGVHILAGVAGNMPLDLMERVNERERRAATSHPVRNLITTRPNHWQTPQDFRRMLTAHVALRGNGYAYKVPGLGGYPQALWPLHPDRCRPVQNPDMSIHYEWSRPDGTMVPLAQSDVLHVRGLSLDGLVGVGVLHFARETIGLSLQAQKAASKMWRQGAMAGGALEHPSTLSDEAYDRLNQSLTERNSGVENAGKWMILEEGMKASEVFLTAQDMQFLESRQFELRQIAMFLGVPPHLLGDTTTSTSWGTGLEQQTNGFIAFGAEDYLTAWEQALVRDLLKPAEQARYYARFNRNALVRGDMKTRFGAYALALQWGFKNPDEVRALEDDNPRPGGDEYYPPPNTAGDPAPDPPEDKPNDPNKA